MVAPLREGVGLRNTVSPFELISDEELACMEAKWRCSMPNYNLVQLLNIFPEAEKIIKKKMKEEIRQCEIDLRTADRIEAEFEREVAWCDNQDFHRMIFKGLYLDGLRLEQTKKIRLYGYYLKPADRRSSGGVTPEEIAQAKQVPIASLIEVHRHQAKCLWHDDKKPSMYIYPENAYCFVCAKAFDTISIVRQLHGLSFVEAVKFLIK